MLKAAKGGGGRGMRMVDNIEQLAAALDSAQREAKNAFGSDEVFVEKLVRKRDTSKFSCWAMITAT